jgi:hypothetical protein
MAVRAVTLDRQSVLTTPWNRDEPPWSRLQHEAGNSDTGRWGADEGHPGLIARTSPTVRRNPSDAGQPTSNRNRFFPRPRTEVADRGPGTNVGFGRCHTRKQTGSSRPILAGRVASTNDCSGSDGCGSVAWRCFAGQVLSSAIYPTSSALARLFRSRSSFFQAASAVSAPDRS